jgi:hypothetical protein
MVIKVNFNQYNELNEINDNNQLNEINENINLQKYCQIYLFCYNEKDLRIWKK